MLWIHIDNTGTVQCSVNVGNRIRQGNPFDAFVVLDGAPTSQNDYEDSQQWELSLTSIIKPVMDNFVTDGVTTETRKSRLTFELGNPSQANSYFVSGVTYEGRIVHFSEQCTTFDGNGGHIAILFTMEKDGGYEYAQNLSVFVEPVFGKKPALLTLSDYAELFSLYRKSNIENLGEIHSLDELNSIYYDPTDPDGYPMSFYTFTFDGRPFFMFVGYDEESGATIQQLMAFDAGDGKVGFFTRQGFGDNWTPWTREYVDPISNIVQTREEDENGLVKNTLTITLDDNRQYSFDYYDGVGIKRITDNAGENWQQTVTVTIHLTDGTTKSFPVRNGMGIKDFQVNQSDAGGGTSTLVFTLDDGSQKTLQVRNGVGIKSIETVESPDDGGTNTIKIKLDNNNEVIAHTTNGRAGSPCLNNLGGTFVIPVDDVSSPLYYGALGLPQSSVNHLVMFYEIQGTAEHYHLVSDDPSSPEYYALLGVPQSLVNHLIYMPNVVTADPVFANNSWAVIKNVCETGRASAYWSVGDYKDIVCPDGVTRRVTIVDMQGLYGKNVVFQYRTSTSGAYSWGTSSSYKNSSVNATVLAETGSGFTNLVPSDLASLLTSTTFKTSAGGATDTVEDVTAKLFLPAAKEVLDGYAGGSYSAENSALTTFQYYVVNSSNADRVIGDSIGGVGVGYWLRSPYNALSTTYVMGTGAQSSVTPNAVLYLAPCFSF